MKKISLLLILVCIFLLCGCAEKDFVKATDGEFSVSMSNEEVSDTSGSEEPVIEEVTEEAKAFFGIWKLNTIADGGSSTNYTNSYYIFNPDGTYSLTVGGQSSAGRFSVKDNTLHLGNSTLSFVMDRTQLTLITKSGKTHILTKIQESN